MANGVTTVGVIDAEVLARMDRTGSEFVPEARRWLWINDSYKELYDILLQKFGDDYYFLNTNTITTNGTNDQFALPADFYKLYGIDLSLTGGGADGWITVKKFTKAERNRYAVPNFQSFYGITNLRYRLRGNNIWFTPIPSSGQQLRLLYAPRPTDIMNVVASDELKFSSDAEATLYSPGSYALNKTYTITEAFSGTQTISFDLKSLSDGFVVYGKLYKNGVAIGTERSNTTTTYVTFSEDITSDWVVGDTLEVWTTTTSAIEAVRNLRIYYEYAPIDGVSGWEQYIVADVCIKYCGAEETDPTLYIQQKMELKNRIEEAAENRDVGSPETVSDSQTNWGPFGGFSNGSGHMP